MQTNYFSLALDILGYAQPKTTEIPSSLLESYLGDTWPLGSWAIDECDFEGLEKVQNALDLYGVTQFVVIRDDRFYTIREANPVHPGKVYDEDSAMCSEYPTTPERGPLGKWSRTDEYTALKRFIYSRCEIAHGSICFTVFRAISQDGKVTQTLFTVE